MEPVTAATPEPAAGVPALGLVPVTPRPVHLPVRGQVAYACGLVGDEPLDHSGWIGDVTCDECGKSTHADRARIIQAYRDLADFLEHFPQVPAPTWVQEDAFSDAAGIHDAIHLTGSWRKNWGSSYLSYIKDFGPAFTLQVNVARGDVCRKVQTGVKQVEAVEAHEEPVFEWVCDPEFAGDAPVADAAVTS